MQQCCVKDCERPHSAKGFCLMHYLRVHRTGTPVLGPPIARQRCSYEGCERWRDSWGYCSTHWRRIQVHGDVTVVKKGGRARSGRLTVLNGGYVAVYAPEHPLAQLQRRGSVLVHRMVLYDAIGPGSHPCHNCGRLVTWGAKGADRLDVDHLDSVRQNNVLGNLAPSCRKCNDGQAKRRQTHCVHGHEYTPENTYLSPEGWRRCRLCMREADRRRQR